MPLDRSTLNKLKRFCQAFKDARDRGANESDTVMFLVKFFEEIMGFDSLAGEISKEVCIKDRYCDFGIKISGNIRYLVEAKAAGNALRDKDIEQAENYGSRAGIKWVLLTNGADWQLYHLTFAEGGISHDIAFEFNLIDMLEKDPERVWGYLNLLTKEGSQEELLEAFWNQKKTLAPSSMVRVLFADSVLAVVRRELNRISEVRLEMVDVFNAIKDVLSKDALMEAGDITLRKRRKKRRRVKKVDAETGQTTEVEEETDEDEDAPGEIVPAVAVDPDTSTPPPSSAPQI